MRQKNENIITVLVTVMF